MSSLSPSSCVASTGARPAKMNPRPCLKHAVSSRSPCVQSTSQHAQSLYAHSQSLTSLASPSGTRSHSHSHVHFPPSQSLSTTFPTHSKKTYDRRPLVVAPNVCALPARGCPGRTYAPGAYMRSEREPADEDKSDYMDVNLDELLFSPPPQWGEMSTPATPTPPQHGLPALIPDHGISSSESEESDALLSPHGNVPYFGYGTDSQMGGRQMDFLPHAPSSEEREIRRRRRREREEERGRWKTGGMLSQADEGSCLGGF